LAINAGRAIFARPTIGFEQEVDVDVVGERREHHLRCFPRQFRYPLQFR